MQQKLIYFFFLLYIPALQAFENVILTPHIGGSTVEAQITIGIDCADNMIRFLEHGITESAVNFPQLNIPLLQSTHSRIIHIHKNVPGMLQKVNQIIYAHGMNILGEWLQTNSKIGYAIMDLEKISNKKQVLEELRNIDGTIRTRIIN